jgi:1-deoxy-D-xylulose-5-phosphate synthase
MVDNGYTNRLIRLGVPDKFVEHGKVDILERDLNLLPEQIAERIEKVFLSKSYKVIG